MSEHPPTTSATKLTLILGGRGKAGRRVAARLRARGWPLRIGSRAGDPPFDWEDRATWAPVLRDVAAAYVTYYPDLASPGAVEAVGAFARLAVERGVRRLVLLSGRGEQNAQAAEQAARESGAALTIVRASYMSQNFSESFWLEAVRHGELAVPAGDVAEPFVDAEDIADVAAAALTEDGHAGRLYEVTGPRLLTFAEAAAEISEATGREVRYVPVSSARFAAALTEAGLPADLVGGLTALFAETLDGHNAYLTDGVRRALGRAPRDFRDFARDAAAAGVWDPEQRAA